jgi:hypothetical protein
MVTASLHEWREDARVRRTRRVVAAGGELDTGVAAARIDSMVVLRRAEDCFGNDPDELRRARHPESRVGTETAGND